MFDRSQRQHVVAGAHGDRDTEPFQVVAAAFRCGGEPPHSSVGDGGGRRESTSTSTEILVGVTDREGALTPGTPQMLPSCASNHHSRQHAQPATSVHMQRLDSQVKIVLSLPKR